jgi:hypothetical protein
MKLFTILPLFAAGAWIALGSYWLIARPPVPVQFRFIFWTHWDVLRERAIAFLGASLIVLGVLALILFAADMPSLHDPDAASGQATAEPIDTTGLSMFTLVVCLGVPYMMIAMLIAVVINRARVPPRKRKPKRKRKRELIPEPKNDDWPRLAR